MNRYRKFPLRVVCMVFKCIHSKKMKDNWTELLVEGGFTNYAPLSKCVADQLRT
jgi:hypothetical protein